jgi:uncharacterized paraquat-inducible protein A|tara:strand:- start:1420 stop:1581 length:162 start_codon:yes stop_codon:yes gene_type:complete
MKDSIEGHIRCKCGKYWGMANHKRNCKRCKTPVIARGELKTIKKRRDVTWDVQ